MVEVLEEVIVVSPLSPFSLMGNNPFLADKRGII
jgi:hypothetical protein